METPLHPTVIHTRHVLAVKNLAVSARYFREQLGFKQDFTVEGWEFLSLGSFKVMLGECPDEVPAAETGNHSYFAHVLMEDVDALYRDFQERGAKFLFPVADKPWGLREFGVVTPDGHRICFGQEIKPSPT
ncbi:MAG TPA: VOC family protein [Pirellulaceae bacterium]|nr:VOC family protein [Pirellulaceae bacterium]